MNSAIRWLALVVVVAAAGAGFYLWQQSQSQPPPSELLAQPRPVQPRPSIEVSPTPEASPEPLVRYPVEAAQAKTGEGVKPLPPPDQGDELTSKALAGLSGAKGISQIFNAEDIVYRIVVTIDNLPRDKAPVHLRPLKSAPGLFAAAGSDDSAVVTDKNPGRYAPYVRLAEAIDTKKLVALYTELYPLFQRAYQDLGYPKGYFNDRLVEVIDHLLAAPNVSEPIKLVRPKVMYEFADPELEALSAGQKTLIRMGSENARKIKAKLQEIRREITAQIPAT